MNSEVSPATINKLGNEVLEIRLRALKSVELQFKVYDHLNFNGPFLMKALLKWFDFDPICEEIRVLNLIYNILKGDQREDTICTLGLTKLIEKLQMIEKRLNSDSQKDVLRKILLGLSSHGPQSHTDTINDVSLDDMSNISIPCVQSANLTGDSMNAFEYLDYVVPWEVPGPSDLNSLNLLKSSLRLDADEKDVLHAFAFLKTAIVDFPAEYFLQPPYIFQCLKSLLKEKHNGLSVELLEIFANMTKALQKRVKIRQLSRTFCWEETRQPLKKTQISVGRYFSEVFQITLNYFKDIIHSSDTSTTLQQEFHSCFAVMFTLIELASLTSGKYQFHEILMDLGYLTKYFRKTWDKAQMDQSNRNLYINTLYLMSKIVLLRHDINLNSTADTLKDECSSIRDSDSKYSSQGDANVWRQELETALFDFMLKQSYAEVYETVLKAVQTYSEIDVTIQHLLNCDLMLKPAVELLQEPFTGNNEEFITSSLTVIQTLSLHRSNDLVQRIFMVVQDSIPNFDGNTNLKEKCETILLKLIAHDDVQMKRTIYRLCCKNVKSYFSSLMEGSAILSKTYSSNTSNTRFLGIPLTSEMIIEFISFGLDHIDEQIRSNAETILCLILKSKSMMSSHWMNIFEILAPTLPLLLCYASKKTALGHAILSMLTPDSDLPTQFLVQGNVILLFNQDYQIRQDAVAALMYLLLDQIDAELYLPNIQNITDVIPSNICILDNLTNPKQKCISGIHERQSMDSLIELLRTSNMEPSERKTTFLQLNILTQDPGLTEIFHDASGLYLCLDALQNALKENQSTDYHDSAIPLIGIVSKMFLQLPEYRHEFVHDTNTYYALLRALLIFHQHSGLKTDCAIALFILAFGEHSLGSYNVSLPNVCQKLKVPFVCEFHWKESQYNEKSHIESLLLNAGNDHTSDRMSNGVEELNTNRSHMSAKLKTMWQYVRLQFANLWFSGIEHISIDFTCSADKDLSVIYSSEDNYPNAMTFDRKLALTKGDLKLIQANNVSYVFKYWLDNISNATRHSDVTKALSAISNNLFSPGMCKDALNVATISTTLMRFYTSTPNNAMDELIFGELLAFFENLIKNDHDEFLHWLLLEFKKTNCIFINLLQSSNCSTKCFTTNCRFIAITFEYAIYSENENVRVALMTDLPKIRNESERTNILNKMFSLVMPLLDSTFEKGDLDKFRSLLSLLQIITSSLVVIIDEEFIGHIANKLLHFISSIKSLAQTGSDLNKNCLLVVSNLMHTSEHDIFIEPKYIKFLSGLCGHKDVEIRTFSWTILTLMSRKLKGAEVLIECLSYLPGGFHACCLSTLLDTNDSSTVRELAGTLFTNLIKFVDADRNLLQSVVPRCADMSPKPADNSFDIIIDIIKYQRFFERVSESLKHFFVYELIDENDIATPITTCDMVRVICGILTNLININEGLVELFYDCGLVFDIIRLLPYVKSSTNESAILMLNAICTFMSHCFVKDIEILNQLGLQEHAVFTTLIHCLQSRIYDDFDDDLKMTTFNSVIPIVTFVANTSIGYNLIWGLFTRNEMQPLFEAMVFGLQTKDSNHLTVSVLKLLSSLLTTSGKSETDHFAVLFDEMEATTRQSKHAIVSNDQVIGYQKFVGKRKTEISHASELILSFLVDLFHFSKNNTKIRSNLCKAIALLLFGSVKVRKMAVSIDFANDVLDEIESILSKVGTYGDFVRKYGEQKKEPIISQLKWLYNILMHWFSKVCLTDENVIARLCQILIQTWPWSGSNSSFQLLVIKTLAFLSEDSVPVCKAMATSNTKNSQTVLQIITEHAVAETSKPKQLNTNLESLELILRTISNCCSCVEGRIQLTKLNPFDTLNRLHPTVTKQYKPWNSVLRMWLELYEIYTRYPDVNTTKHLQLLCFLAMKASQRLKVISLTIVRNMAFGSSRPALLASDVLLHTLSHQLENGPEDVQVLVGTCIWRLIANNYRGKHTVRSTSIPAKVILIRNACVSTDQSSELFYIVDTLHNILSN